MNTLHYMQNSLMSPFGLTVMEAIAFQPFIWIL